MSNDKHQCPDCPKSFVSKTEYIRHRDEHKFGIPIRSTVRRAKEGKAPREKSKNVINNYEKPIAPEPEKIDTSGYGVVDNPYTSSLPSLVFTIKYWQNKAFSYLREMGDTIEKRKIDDVKIQLSLSYNITMALKDMEAREKDNEQKISESVFLLKLNDATPDEAFLEIELEDFTEMLLRWKKDADAEIERIKSLEGQYDMDTLITAFIYVERQKQLALVIGRSITDASYGRK